MRDQRHAPAALYPRERPGTHCTGGWVGPRAGTDRCGKSRPHRDSLPGPAARSQSLYRLSCPAHGTGKNIDKRQNCRSQNWRKNSVFGSHTNRTTTLPHTGRYPIKETTRSLTLASKEEAWKMAAAVAFVMWHYYKRQQGVMTQKSVFFMNRAHSQNSVRGTFVSS